MKIIGWVNQPHNKEDKRTKVAEKIFLGKKGLDLGLIMDQIDLVRE